MSLRFRRAAPWPALLAAGLALLLVWALRGGLLPDWWRERTQRADLTGDGAAETLALRAKALTVTDGAGGTLWETPRGWLAQDFLVGDVDRDGAPELLVLVWKRGSYGPSRPFWVERDDPRYSQHIFIYRWDASGRTLRPLWMASALRPRVKSWAMAPDGTLDITTEADEPTRWAWRGWGLERVDLPLRPM